MYLFHCLQVSTLAGELIFVTASRAEMDKALIALSDIIANSETCASGTVKAINEKDAIARIQRNEWLYSQIA